MNELDAVLYKIADTLQRYVVFPVEAQVIALALWVVHTYVLGAADVTPYLAVTSATKRSGKSLLLDLLELLVFRPWRVASPSEATLFRKVSTDHPTLLWDEVDAVFKVATGNENLRAVLNSGHRRGTRVPRCVGEGSKVRVEDFDVFSAKALAGIGRLPDTVADRAIPIRLQRRAKGETVTRFRYREVEQETADLRQWLEAWAEGVVEGLRDARPAIPEALDDRAADGWEPLLAIADVAGGQWPTIARAAALDLADKSEDETWGVVLLEHLRDIFGDRDRLPTEKILEALVAREDGPWGDWWGSHVDKGETKGPASQLARNLKPFDIKPKKFRLDDDKTARGYVRADLEPVWDRYLPPGLLETRNMAHSHPQTRPLSREVPLFRLFRHFGGAGKGTARRATRRRCVVTEATVTANGSSPVTEAVTCHTCSSRMPDGWEGPRRDALAEPHCRSCHRDGHRACRTCGSCLSRGSRWDRHYCSATCRVKAKRAREAAELERAVWKSEHPEEVAQQRAKLEELEAKLKAVGDVLTPPEARERGQRIADVKARADRCAQCDEPFANAVIYRRRGGVGAITDPVLPFCEQHRCRAYRHNREAPEGYHYVHCRCDDRYWTAPEACVGCGRFVSHSKRAPWRRMRGWAYVGEREPAAPRVFCGLECKQRVLAVEARARRIGTRAEGASCSICKTSFTPARADARYCSHACRQRAYRERRGAAARWRPRASPRA